MSRAAVVIALMLCALPAWAMRPGTAVVATRAGEVRLTLEITQTPAEQARGLMFRTELPPQHGMLFSFDRQPTMWMKNTRIPLDMIFWDDGGRVVSIHKNARPMDETIIASDAPARGVIEVSAGEADRLGIVVGDSVAIVPQ
ncbi:MAG: DUF192 domain-containing protein [Alphaproteobacteria bacterium]|nr:DUF192 domain-containing protein [Alphaproteobacteria bacterium]